MSFIGGSTGTIHLQQTIAAATSGVGGDNPPAPHHPITCSEELYFDEEGVMSCDHTKTEKGDPRTQACLNHSLALLIVELATKL